MDKAFIVAGLGFGDEGKGTIVDFLTRHYKADLVVRYNGGPQALHHVVDGETWHGFSQFGAGTLAGAKTFLSEHMLVEPYALMNEAQVLQINGIKDPLALLTIDPDCVIITPWQRWANRLREVGRGNQRHGSCGLGIGETKADMLDGYSLKMSDLYVGGHAEEKLHAIREKKYAEMTKLFGLRIISEIDGVSVVQVVDRYRRFLIQVKVDSWSTTSKSANTIVFEGAQGVMLDEQYGYTPYTTWSDCTFNNAEKLLASINYSGYKERIGVLRTYYTRHGAGPFPTQDDNIFIADKHNGMHPYMGNFRIGNFDVPLAKYAIDVCGGIDYLALTHLDSIPSIRIAIKHNQLPGAYENPYLPNIIHYEDILTPRAKVIPALLNITLKYASAGADWRCKKVL